MAHAELTQAATGEAISPRPRTIAAFLEASLAMLVEIPAALLVTAEIVILFAGVVARYGLHRPLIWSDELGSIIPSSSGPVARRTPTRWKASFPS